MEVALKAVLLATATALVLSGAAYAQTPAQTPAPTQAPAASAGAPHTTLRQQMRSDLEKAGFSDVHVMPESFLVHAKDSSGNPVSMFVSPDSVTEVATLPAGQNGSGANGGQTFVNVPQSDKLTSNIVGLSVTNTSNQDIGTIKDVALGSDGIQAYVLSVGGFLGMGDHYVAVNPNAVKVTYNTGDKKWHATMNATADQLKNAPEFKYMGNKS